MGRGLLLLRRTCPPGRTGLPRPRAGQEPPVIRIGLVGAGFIASRHVESLAGIPGVAVAGVADPRPDRAEQLAGRAGARAYPAWDRLLDSQRLDAGYLSVPPHPHGPLEEAPRRLGPPVFVEKPPPAALAP